MNINLICFVFMAKILRINPQQRSNTTKQQTHKKDNRILCFCPTFMLRQEQRYIKTKNNRGKET